jgi:predicted nucleic-acid-binding Zn-ribbon protein
VITRITGAFSWTPKDKYSEKRYLKLVSRHARRVGLDVAPQFIDQISSHAAELFLADIEYISDAPSQFHLLLTSYLLATVEVLEHATSSDNAKKIAGNAFIANGRYAIYISMKAGLLFSRDKFAFVQKNGGKKSIEAYGKGFKIELETDNATFLTTRVKRCGFHEYFMRHGRPELTKLMCDWDNNWADALRKSKEVRFDRPTTIAAGDDSCAFQFRKVGK